MRVAVVHDYLTQRGGAERVVLSLMKLFPEADLYTSVYDPDGTYPEFEGHVVRTSSLQRFVRPGRDARGLLPLYPRSFGNLRLSGYDLVISSSSGFAHGVEVTDGTHVVYCYNPPRWLYRAEEYFAAGSPAPAWAMPAVRPLLRWMRAWDQRAAARPDHYISISSEVAKRVDAAYGRESTAIVTPPVDVHRIAAGPRAEIEGEPYVLAVSRLLPYKRVEIVAAACKQLGLRLVVVGEGPCYDEVKAAGSPHIEMRGRVDDEELNGLLHGCIAAVQAGTEDFGLGPLEANAAGRPAVAFAAGGALETVIDGVSGLLVHEQTVDAFAAAIDRARSMEWDIAKIRTHAESFSEPAFHADLALALTYCMAEVPVALLAPEVTRAPVAVAIA